jgi:hypothetical protein
MGHIMSLETESARPRTPKGRRGVVIGVIVAVLAMLVGGGAWISNKTTYNAGHTIENRLMRHQAEVYVMIDRHLRASAIASQAATTERASATQMIYQAVSGRYVDPNGGTTPPKAALGQGWAISSLREQYPQISDALFKEAVTIAIGTLDDMAGAQLNAQNDVQDLRDFKTNCVLWCGVHDAFPTSNLVFVDPATRQPSKRGMEALYHFSVPIMSKQAAGAAQSGILDDPNYFGGTPSPTSSTTTPAPTRS